MRTWTPLLLPALLTLLLGACTKPTATSGAPVATCTSAGQQCQYADGKIGLCTANGMECDGGQGCLVCMSLH
ncbi:MAG: hypothetical protein ACLQVI_40285 [Polyangiaceae bacterium]